MKKIALLMVLLALAGTVAGWMWWSPGQEPQRRVLVLYGNLDLRQVMLAFNHSERIAEVLVHEGDRVARDQVVARLDTSRLAPQAAQAEAQAAAQRHVVERLRNGSRPEEIAQQRANLESAQAEAANARLQYDRNETLYARNAVTQEVLEDSGARLQIAQAQVAVNQAALDLAIAGPRQEQIAEAEAMLRSAEARAALLKRQLAEAELVATTDGVVRNRLLEPGEMASPQRPVMALAIMDPKWVRAYVSESDLGRVRPGMMAWVTVDSFPAQKFKGWVGFISPVAEFTPKTIETEELRTSLVYETRVFVRDPSNRLRLGMPATVQLPLSGRGGDAQKESRP